MSYRWSFNASKWEPTASQLAQISGIIQSEEKARIGRFVFMRDAKSSLIGRLLIRKLIQLKTGIPNHLIKLGRDDHNKPILLISNEDLAANHVELLLNNVEQDDDNNKDTNNSNLEGNSLDPFKNNLNFNISHQGSFVVLASDPLATLIGIDVMNIDKPGRIADSVDEYFRLMNRQFTEAEWKQIKGLDSSSALLALSDKKKMTNFTRFWCLKEAYVKAIGVGIVIDLRTVDFKIKTDLLGDANAVATDTLVKVNGVLETEWEFEERCLDETHLVAVAKKLEEGSERKQSIIPEFTNVSLDFLLENMTPLGEEDKEWVDTFLQKNKRK